MINLCILSAVDKRFHFKRNLWFSIMEFDSCISHPYPIHRHYHLFVLRPQFHPNLFPTIYPQTIATSFQYFSSSALASWLQVRKCFSPLQPRLLEFLVLCHHLIYGTEKKMKFFIKNTVQKFKQNFTSKIHS